MDLKEALHKQNQQRHPWEMARFRFFSELVQNSLLSIQKKGGILMDVGCGDTWFVEQIALQYPNIRYFAVDINFSDEHLKIFREKYKDGRIQVFRTVDEAAAGMNAKQADMVLLLDVIEHIQDDIDFLQMLRKSSSTGPDTELVITVPAYQSLFSSHDVFLEHYRRYTNSMLIEHTRQGGWKAGETGYFFFSLLLARILVWAKEKLIGAKKYTTGLVEWDKGPLITGLVQGALVTDYRVSRWLRKLGIRLPGLSNYTICKPLP
jgi:SAM-dependent methyltransferase